MNRGRRCRREACPLGFPSQDRAEDLDDGFAGERGFAGKHFEKHGAERPDVGTRVRAASLGLFGRHVLRRSEDHARHRSTH